MHVSVCIKYKTRLGMLARSKYYSLVCKIQTVHQKNILALAKSSICHSATINICSFQVIFKVYCMPWHIAITNFKPLSVYIRTYSLMTRLETLARMKLIVQRIYYSTYHWQQESLHYHQFLHLNVIDNKFYTTICVYQYILDTTLRQNC